MCDGDFLDKHVVKEWSLCDYPPLRTVPWNVIPGDVLVTGASGNHYHVDGNDVKEVVHCVSGGCGMTPFETTVLDMMRAGF